MEQHRRRKRQGESAREDSGKKRSRAEDSRGEPRGTVGSQTGPRSQDPSMDTDERKRKTEEPRISWMRHWRREVIPAQACETCGRSTENTQEDRVVEEVVDATMGSTAVAPSGSSGAEACSAEWSKELVEQGVISADNSEGFELMERFVRDVFADQAVHHHHNHNHHNNNHTQQQPPPQPQQQPPPPQPREQERGIRPWCVMFCLRAGIWEIRIMWRGWRNW